MHIALVAVSGAGGAAPALTSFSVRAADGSLIGEQEANVPFSIRIRALDQFGGLFSGFVSTVDVTSDGSLSAGEGTTASFVAGQLIHEVEFDAEDASVTISVADTATGLITGISNAFDVGSIPITDLANLMGFENVSAFVMA